MRVGLVSIQPPVQYLFIVVRNRRAALIPCDAVPQLLDERNPLFLRRSVELCRDCRFRIMASSGKSRAPLLFGRNVDTAWMSLSVAENPRSRALTSPLRNYAPKFSFRDAEGQQGSDQQVDGHGRVPGLHLCDS